MEVEAKDSDLQQEGVYEVSYLRRALEGLIGESLSRNVGRVEMIEKGNHDPLIVAALNNELSMIDGYKNVAQALKIDLELPEETEVEV